MSFATIEVSWYYFPYFQVFISLMGAILNAPAIVQNVLGGWDLRPFIIIICVSKKTGRADAKKWVALI